MPQFWLEAADGVRLAIRAAGVIIGRAARCDYIIDDPEISRAHAIVYASSAGPAITALGKAPTAVNGDAIDHSADLSPGDRIELAGRVLTIAAGEAPAAAATGWVVRGPGGLFGVVRTPFSVGSAATSDLVIAGWPATVLRFHLADSLHVEAYEPLVIDGRPCESGDVAALPPGAIVRWRDSAFEVVAGGSFGQDSTVSASPTAQAWPAQVRLEFLSRGGRLHLEWRGQERTVYLPERRCDLVAALLQPPPPFAAGDFVPDEVILPRIWPGKAMSRVDLNVLLRRARLDLVRGELDGARLLARSEGGNATAFRLANGARVTIE